MKQVTILALLCASLILNPTNARADLAPTPIDGKSLTPVEHSEVRMDSEFVDIRLGPRVSEDNTIHLAGVAAHFRMVNDSPDTLVVKIGFPVFEEFGRITAWSPPDVYHFRVSVDDGEFFAPDTSYVTGEFSFRMPARHLWFGWTMSFPPGETAVDVEYNIRSSYSYKRGFQNLYYTISTGRFWKGTIGRAIVQVVFPDDIAAGMLMPMTTPGHTIERNVIRWEYSDYEPREMEQIQAEFIPPDLMRELTELRLDRPRSHDDFDPANALREATIYLELGSYGARDPRYPDFMSQAERLLRVYLHQAPGDAEAWNLLLGNHWRIPERPDRRRRVGQFDVTDERREVIAEAYSHCPDDRRIQLWNTIAFDTLWEVPDTLGYAKEYPGGEMLIRVPVDRRVWDPQVALRSEDWKGVILEPARRELVETFYARNGDYESFLLIRNDREMSADAHGRLSAMFRDADTSRWRDELLRLNREMGMW